MGDREPFPSLGLNRTASAALGLRRADVPPKRHSLAHGASQRMHA